MQSHMVWPAARLPENAACVQAGFGEPLESAGA